jgi:phage tail sheath protein FI
MTVTTTHPGVYLSESSSLNFSVTNTATAVPAFAFRSVNGLPISGKIHIYYNWIEFATDYDDQSFTENDFYNTVRLWFLNGGGKCYLVNMVDIYDAVSQYDEITLVVAAGEGANISDQFNQLINEGYHIFGLFDGPKQKIGSSDTQEAIMENYLQSPFAAAFYPWSTVNWTTTCVPPSAAAAAAIALTDRTRGVWKAPANVVINGITPNYAVSDDLQGRFNQEKALNMIRTFPGIGTMVWGARTLDDSDNWRYIPVRRLFSMVERNIQKALNKMVFEPNSQPTWQRVKAALDNYLYSLWQEGALQGNKADEAWFVQIGKDITMTDDDINQGKMIVKIGLAAVRPAEFIILQFSQDIAK